jgi:phosphatidylethanolamine-binding protein (PEBP) family uncharacterized protein
LALLGKLLKNRRAGETNLAWSLPALAGPDGITVRSADFEPEAAIARANAGKRAGGRNQSPELSWTGVPAGTAQLLLVVQDVDSPTSVPFVHCVALLEAGLGGVPAGALNTGSGGADAALRHGPWLPGPRADQGARPAPLRQRDRR